MSDTIDDYRSIKDHKKRLRAKYGVDCQLCKKIRPKTNPTILLPQQKCKVCGFKDERTELTNEEYSSI